MSATRSRKYRGHYPTRINTVYGMKDHSVLVVCNDGSKWSVWPLNTEGSKHLPRHPDDMVHLKASGNYRIEVYHAQA